MRQCVGMLESFAMTRCAVAVGCGGIGPPLRITFPTQTAPFIDEEEQISYTCGIKSTLDCTLSFQRVPTFEPCDSAWLVSTLKRNSMTVSSSRCLPSQIQFLCKPSFALLALLRP